MPISRSHKQKPQAWGPVSQVQASIFKNAERIGIDSASIALVMPMWGPGDQLDYAHPNNPFTNNLVDHNHNVLSFNGSSSYLSQVSNSGIFASAPFTTHVKIKNNGTDATNHWIYTKEDSLLANGDGFRRNGSGLYIARGTTGSYHYKASGAIADGQRMTVSHRYISTSNFDTFIDGKPVVGWTKATPYNDISVATLQIGRSNGSYQGYWNGDIEFFYVFNAALNNSQIAYLSDNPYFLLQRVSPVFFSIPGGGVTPTFKPFWAANATRIAI